MPLVPFHPILPEGRSISILTRAKVQEVSLSLHQMWGLISSPGSPRHVVSSCRLGRKHWTKNPKTWFWWILFCGFEQMNLPDLQTIQLERHNTHICSPGKGTYNKLIKNGTEVQLSEPMSSTGIPNRSVGIVEYYFNWTKICCICLCCGILF